MTSLLDMPALEIPGGLSEDEFLILDDWQLDGFLTINRFLREGRVPARGLDCSVYVTDRASCERAVDLIDHVIGRWLTSAPQTLYRGVALHRDRLPCRDKPIWDPGFTSWTASFEVAALFAEITAHGDDNYHACVYETELPAGACAFPFTEVIGYPSCTVCQEYGLEEDEVLLPRGFPFELVSREPSRRRRGVPIRRYTLKPIGQLDLCPAALAHGPKALLPSLA